MPTGTQTIPITQLSQLNPEGLYSYADYLTWKFKERVELIKGHLFPMSPAPNLLHQEVTGNLYLSLRSFFKGKSCRVIIAPFDVLLPFEDETGQNATIVKPDLFVVCDPEKLNEQSCVGAPDLVVEVLSPGNSKKEMRNKDEAYEAAGVSEYWLVHPLDREVRVYVRNELGVFIGLAPVIEEDVLVSAIFPDLKIDLKEVFNS